MATVKDIGTIPSATEFGKLRSHLANVGVSQAAIKAVIGDTVNNQTRAEIAEKLRVWLKAL